jgi:hypothetical protein
MKRNEGYGQVNWHSVLTTEPSVDGFATNERTWGCKHKSRSKWKCFSNCKVLEKVLGFPIFLIPRMIVENI